MVVNTSAHRQKNQQSTSPFVSKQGRDCFCSGNTVSDDIAIIKDQAIHCQDQEDPEKNQPFLLSGYSSGF